MTAKAKLLSTDNLASMYAIVCNFAAAALTGLVGILVSHILGPQGRGIYATAVVWGSIISFLIQLGVNQSVVYMAASEPAQTDRVLAGTLCILAVQTVLILLFASFAAPHIGWYPEPTREAIRLYLLYIPPSLLLTYLTCFSLGSKSTAQFNVMRVVTALPPLLAVVAALIMGPSLRMILRSLVFGGYAISITALFLICRNCKLKLRGTQDISMAPALIAYGMRSYWANISWFANMRVDQLFLSFAVSPVALGNYSVAVSYSLLLSPLYMSIANLGFAKVAAAKQSDKANLMWDAVRKGMILSAGGLAILCGLRSILLPMLYGHKFQGAVSLSPILCLGALFLAANYILGDCLRGLNMPGYVSKAESAALVATLGGLYIATPRFGAFGAAWVSLIAYGMVTALLAHRVSRPLFAEPEPIEEPEMIEAQGISG